MGEAKKYILHLFKICKKYFDKKNQRNRMADQTERAFQKQKNVFLNNKAALIAGPKAKKIRYVKNVGLGFKTPMEAKEGNYIDKKCPLHRTRPDPRQNPQWRRPEAQDATHRRHQKRLPSLHQEVQAI